MAYPYGGKRGEGPAYMAARKCAPNSIRPYMMKPPSGPKDRPSAGKTSPVEGWPLKREEGLPIYARACARADHVYLREALGRTIGISFYGIPSMSLYHVEAIRRPSGLPQRPPSGLLMASLCDPAGPGGRSSQSLSQRF